MLDYIADADDTNKVAVAQNGHVAHAMAGHQAHHVRDSVGRGDGDHAVSHDFAHRHRNSSLTITSNCVNNFTFGNETNNCVAARHHERADIFCMQPARRPLDAGFRSYCCDVGSLLPQNAVDGHRHSILQSYGLTAYLTRPRNWGACHGIRSPLRGALAYHIGRKQSASIGDRATDQSLVNWCLTGSGQSLPKRASPAMSALPPLATK